MAGIELVKSRATRRAGRSSTHERIYNITGAQDSAVAIAVLIAAAPGSVIVDQVNLDYVEYDVDPVTGDTWTGKVAYSHRLSNQSDVDREPGDEETTFDFVTETIHLTDAISQTKYDPPGGTAPDVGTAINYTERDGPQGVEIPTAAGVFGVTRIFAANDINQAWVRQVGQQVGKINNAPWKGFQTGEVMFTRFAGRQRGSLGDWVVNFGFKFGENEPNITVAGVPGISKDAFDYVWVKYQEDVDTTAHSLKPKTQGVYVAKVIKTTDFTQLGLGG